VNFTREPIIETIITPKDGSKLIVRSSKGEGQEEYTVDAVEVVSFGHALFFRSTEKPKSFLVPVGDYEVVEAKETRVVLKNASFERTIKIGGGREAPIRRESPEKPEEEIETTEEPAEDVANVQRFDRKRDRRRHRNKRRALEERETQIPASPESIDQDAAQDAVLPVEAEAPKPKEEVPSNHFTSLIPPPKTLISDSIKKYKEMQTEAAPPAVVEKPAEEKPEIVNEEPLDEGDSNTISRKAVSSFTETFQTTTTFFSNLSNWTGF